MDGWMEQVCLTFRECDQALKINRNGFGRHNVEEVDVLSGETCVRPVRSTFIPHSGVSHLRWRAMLKVRLTTMRSSSLRAARSVRIHCTM